MENIVSGANGSLNNLVFCAPYTATATEPSLHAPSADGKVISRCFAPAII